LTNSVEQLVAWKMRGLARLIAEVCVLVDAARRGVRLRGLGRCCWTECEFGQLSKVLHSGSKCKFVVRAGGTAQPQAVHFHDALQMGEQHLDLLPVAT
jgi:hypothetical protein